MIRRAFTLVELLVVIGIIGLLISIVLPALSRARQVAVELKCANTLRQLALANISYSIDNKGWFVPVRGWASSPDKPRWCENPAYCAFLNVSVNTTTTPNWTPLWPKALMCPNAYLAGESNVGAPQYGWIYYSYGYNYESKKWVDYPAFRNSEIRRPSEKMMFADSLDWNMSYTNSANYVADAFTTPKPQIAFRHSNNKAVNIAFADGHVTRMERGEVVCTAKTDLPYQRLWDLLQK